MNTRYSFLNKSVILKIFIIPFIILSLNSSVKSTTISIAVGNNFFSPSNVTVSVGDTIRWQWIGGSHTTSCDGVLPGTSLPPGAPCLGTRP